MSATDNLNPRQKPGFRMQTNMKAAVNSQGTLFQGGYPTRYPRGYTPERREEVLHAMDQVQQFPPDSPRVIMGKTGPHDARDPAYLRRKSETTRGVESIARSTVPAEHIRGVEFTFGVQRPAMAHQDLGGWYNATGSDWGGPAIKVVQGESRGMLPIHEIGHSVSSRIDRNPHAAYNTPAYRGQEEGYAENYAEQHYRDRGGRPLKNYDSRPDFWSSQESGGVWDEQHFEDAFYKEREKSPTGRAEVEARARHRKQYQTELLYKSYDPDNKRYTVQVPGQGGLF